MSSDQSQTQLARAREAYERRSWREAYDLLSASDEIVRLGDADLEHWGVADRASVLLQIGAVRPPAPV
jgi:hypothetical protein